MTLTAAPLAIPDVVRLESKVFTDGRGHFLEAWNARAFRAVGIDATFVQDNVARSRRGILRGMHYQRAQPQGKLLRVVRGAIFDVAVDVRASSPTFGQWVGELLTAESGAALWIPVGFAHGYLVLSDEADVTYKATDYYAPGDEYGVRWDDPALAISWPLDGIGTPIVAPRDQALPALTEALHFP